jgi:hypothetical protein
MKWFRVPFPAARLFIPYSLGIVTVILAWKKPSFSGEKGVAKGKQSYFFFSFVAMWTTLTTTSRITIV